MLENRRAPQKTPKSQSSLFPTKPQGKTPRERIEPAHREAPATKPKTTYGAKTLSLQGTLARGRHPGSNSMAVFSHRLHLRPGGDSNRHTATACAEVWVAAADLENRVASGVAADSAF
jgi:hypothetical protein